LIRFNGKGFKDPFYAQQMSDGTLKVFAYLLLLEDPIPPPFICMALRHASNIAPMGLIRPPAKPLVMTLL